MSLQTLHPVSFDEGIILDQTPWPGIDVPEDCDYPGLLKIMQPLGAKMLLTAIRNRLYLPPDNGVVRPENVTIEKKDYKRAPKIDTAHRLLCFETMDSSHILRMSRAFEATWSFASVLTQTLEFKKLRVIFQEPFKVLSPMDNNDRTADIPPGLPYWPENAITDEKRRTNHPLLINTVDGKTLLMESMKVEGGVKMPAYSAAVKYRLISQRQRVISHSVVTFHECLTTLP